MANSSYRRVVSTTEEKKTINRERERYIPREYQRKSSRKSELLETNRDQSLCSTGLDHLPSLVDQVCACTRFGQAGFLYCERKWGSRSRLIFILDAPSLAVGIFVATHYHTFLSYPCRQIYSLIRCIVRDLLYRQLVNSCLAFFPCLA